MNTAEHRTAAVIVASTSAATDAGQDLTGPIICDWLAERGFAVDEPIRVADGTPVAEALQRELARGHRVILTTGGTGVSRDDHTPEVTKPLLDLEVPGLMEQLRATGQQHTPYAILSRGVAGFSGDTFVMNFPGSKGGVIDGLGVLAPVLNHLLEQRIHGGGHAPRTTGG